MRQVGRQVWHHVAADELPPEVIVLTLVVLALVRVAVLLEGAASCGERDPSVLTETPQSDCSLPKSPASMVCCPSRNAGRPQASPQRAPVSKGMVLSAANPPISPIRFPHQ